MQQSQVKEWLISFSDYKSEVSLGWKVEIETNRKSGDFMKQGQVYKRHLSYNLIGQECERGIILP